jgi:sigma-B regulation protein RsbU (phosphoserine phosphatase)
MAKLHTAVRAFAPGSNDPGELCSELNEALWGIIAPGKVVTFFYGVLNIETLVLCFENAGRCSPIVLRGEEAMILAAGGTVLGLFPTAAD